MRDTENIITYNSIATRFQNKKEENKKQKENKNPIK